MVPLQEEGFVEQADYVGLLVGYVGDWAEAEVLVEEGLDDWVLFC